MVNIFYVEVPYTQMKKGWNKKLNFFLELSNPNWVNIMEEYEHFIHLETFKACKGSFS